MASHLQAEMALSVPEERVEAASPDVQEQRCPSEAKHMIEDASPDPQEHRPPDEQPSSVAATPLEKRKIVIVIAGQSGSGKSTALNNLFGTDFKVYSSADSVTKSVGLRRTEGTEGDLIIVDTPAFGATDLRTKDVKKELEDSVGYLDCVLIYCYSISYRNYPVADEVVVKNLQQVLGMKIWQKCVVLFTFSDQVRDQCFDDVESREAYKDLIRKHAKTFHEMLQKTCGDHVPNVKTVFDIDLNAEDIRHIVAVPVGLLQHKQKEKYELVPDVDTTWLDTAFFEIIRKSNKENQEVYLDHLLHGKRHILGAAISGIGVGAAIGAAGGVVAGAATLGFGAIAIPVGAAIGAVIGGAAATTGSLSLRKMRDLIIANRKKERLKKLEEKAQIMQPKPADQSQQTNSRDKQGLMASLGLQEVLLPIPLSHQQERNSNKFPPTPVVPLELPEFETYDQEMDNASSRTSQEPTTKDSAAENP